MSNDYPYIVLMPDTTTAKTVCTGIFQWKTLFVPAQSCFKTLDGHVMYSRKKVEEENRKHSWEDYYCIVVVTHLP